MPLTLRSAVLDLIDFRTWGGLRRPRPHEQACLEAFKSKLSERGVGILEKQLARLNLIERSPDARIVAFHDTRRDRRAPWPDGESFAIGPCTVAVARVTLRPTHVIENDLVKAEIECHNNRFFSIEFHEPPKHLVRGAHVVAVELLLDPMRSGPVETQPLSLTDVSGSIGEFLRSNDARDLRHPLSADDRRKLARTLAARIPDDYQALVGVTEGAAISDWRIHGLRDVWRQINPEGTYYVLAESERAGWVGLAQGDDSGELFWGLHEAHEDDTRRVGTALLPFIAAPPDPAKWEELPPREPDPPVSLRYAALFSGAVATLLFVVMSLALWLLPRNLRQLVQVGPLQLNILVGVMLGAIVFAALMRAALREWRKERSSTTPPSHGG